MTTFLLVNRLNAPTEYYCPGCNQLLLNLDKLTKCINCGTKITITGKPGDLNRRYLDNCHKPKKGDVQP